MPLAVMRRQVKDLPSAFALTDAMAMSAQLKLSDYPDVVVGARVSRSGQAMPQPGDWQGLSAPVKLGTKDIRIEINEAVK
jgi:cytochrome c-type biogenesis protein CcmH